MHEESKIQLERREKNALNYNRKLCKSESKLTQTCLTNANKRTPKQIDKLLIKDSHAIKR